MAVIEKPRPQVGLLLSIGEQVPVAGKPNVTRPAKLDHFRAKPGQLGQYTEAMDKFVDVYGDMPKKLDVVLVSNEIPDVLDVRVKWWGQSGLKGMGTQNLATYGPDEFTGQLGAWDWEIVAYPMDVSEVPPDLRSTWNGEPLTDRLRGPEDPRIAKYKMKVYATFRCALHRVTGLTTLAEISTTSRRSTTNLYEGIRQLQTIASGRIVGIPLELIVRPTRGRYFDAQEKKRKTTDFYELVLQTPYSVEEFYDLLRKRARSLGGGGEAMAALPPVQHDDAVRDGELFDSQERRVEALLDGVRVPDDDGPLDEFDGIEFAEGEVVEP